MFWIYLTGDVLLLLNLIKTHPDCFMGGLVSAGDDAVFLRLLLKYVSTFVNIHWSIIFDTYFWRSPS